MKPVLGLLRWLTVDQYRAIDEAFLDRERQDPRLVYILLLVAICMILPRYFGRSAHIESVAPAMAWFATLPHPDLYPRIYWAAFKVVNYLIVPGLFVKLVLRERIRDFGLKLTRDPRVLALYLAMFLVVLPLVYFVSDSPAFLARYPKYAGAGGSYYQLFAWEIAYGAQFFLLELFFRGIALFALARHLGHAAIFVMVIPYAMIHFGKALPETLGSIVAGVALGTLALRTRSIHGGVIIHCLVAWSMDLFAMHHRGDLERLYASGRLI